MVKYSEDLFNRCFDFELKNEGNYANHPNDRGGETYRGIARNFWGKWEGWKIVDYYKSNARFPKILIEDEKLDLLVRKFYKDNFWNKMNLDLIVNENVVLQLFDMGINAGIKTSIRIAQRICKTTQDGILGVKTAYAINSFGSEFFNKYVEGRILYYKKIVAKRPKNKVFLKGWMKRAYHTKFTYKNEN